MKKNRNYDDEDDLTEDDYINKIKTVVEGYPSDDQELLNEKKPKWEFIVFETMKRNSMEFDEKDENIKSVVDDILSDLKDPHINQEFAYFEKYYGGSSIVDKYGKNKNKRDPNLSLAQYNSASMEEAANTLKSTLGEAGENLEGFGTDISLNGWLYYVMKTAPGVYSESYADPIYLKMAMSALSQEDNITFAENLEVDIMNPVNPDTKNKMGFGNEHWPKISEHMEEKKKFIYYFNKYLKENEFPNPLTDYEIPHTIPYTNWNGAPTTSGGYEYHDDDWINVTPETKTKKGKENIVFAGWKQDGIYPNDPMRYIYIEIENSELKSTDWQGNDITYKLEDVRKSKFQDLTSAGNLEVSGEKSPFQDDGQASNVVYNDMHDLSYYLLWNNKIKEEGYTPPESNDRVSTIKNTQRMLLIEMQKDIQSLINEYLVKFGVDKTRAAQAKRLEDERIAKEKAAEEARLAEIERQRVAEEKRKEEERLGRLRKISDEIDLLTKRLNELLQNQN